MIVRRTSVLMLLCFLALAPMAHAASDVVISQVYGGGGNSGAPYKNDFVELYNRGTAPVSLAGWSVQYASSSGTSWQVTALSGSIAPGHYYLVQEAAGSAAVAALPAPDATGSISMSATAGKVALVASTAALSGSCPAAIDMVGFGSANCFEGAAPTATLSNTTAALRASNGCTDTDGNNLDFSTGAPSPRNSASAAWTCNATTNAAPTINAVANPIATVNQGAPAFTVTIGGNDDDGIYNWSAAPGTGIASVSVTNGATANATFTVSLQPSFSGTATFTAALSDNVNAATTRTVNIAVTPAVANAAPAITPFANPVLTVAQDAAPFTVNLSGTDDNNIYNWSATAGTGVANVSVSNSATANATFSITLQPGFSGTASFTAALSDNVNPNTTANVTITVTAAPPPPLDHVVISQLYGAGGNSGATYQNDFVELYNPTTTAVDLGGWTIQYASATGTSTWQAQPLGGIIAPGEYYLIALATSGAIGAPLPSANISGTLNMSGTAGKVALSRAGDPLFSCAIGDPDLVDLVGYGSTANCREGATNAPAPSSTTALFRKNGGFTDTNVNGADFQTGTPNPRRTTPIQEIGPSVLTTDPRTNGTNAPRDASITITFTESVDVNPGWYSIACATSGAHNDAAVAGSASSWIITPNVNFTPGETCSVTIFAAQIHDSDLDDSGLNADSPSRDTTFTFTVASGAPPAYSAGVHLTFGNPSNAVADVNTPDNYLMVKPEFAMSYNRDHGTPNWVSWHLADEWIGDLTRNDTFRPDPAVPADWYRVLHTDYFASGFDRGHMTPNADRDNENSIPSNQATFLMSNMIPQAPDNNQGPWAAMESYLRTLLPANELYIVAGPAGIGGTGSSGFMTTFANGHVTVPAQTWKVALVLPKSGGDDVSRVTAGARTIAVILPNAQGIRNTDWTSYLTTVDAVEALTGYDFFSEVPDTIENAIEAGVNGTNPPGVANQSMATDEDTTATITLEAASPSSALTYTIVTAPQHGTLTGTGATRTYTPAADYFGSDSFTFWASDGTSTSNTATVSINVVAVNDTPTATDDVRATNEDTPLQFAAWELTSNDSAGPANENQSLVVSSVNGATLQDGMITYTPPANFNGASSFTYEVCDSGHACTTASVTVNVAAVNDAPSAAITAPATSIEGAAVTASISTTDVDANDTATIHWTVTKNGNAYANGNGANVALTPNDDGTYVVTATVTDAAGATGNASATINVANAAPVIASMTAPNAPVAVNAAAAFAVNFTDAGADAHNAVFTWGDGASSPATCSAGVCAASHNYTAAGIYTVNVVLTDDDGGVATSAANNVVIYDANGGFVTAGGWMATPSGKATVTMNAKYARGATTPTGSLRFEVAGATFVATSFDWLVVNGPTVRVQGSGTINGAGNYAVAITAGANNALRVKVWDKATNASVYDSGDSVVNGSVTVHP